MISTLIFRMCIVVVIGLVFMTAYQSVTNKGEPTSFFGYQPLTVLSNSMNPIFSTGDLLLVKKTDATQVKTNDIITFREPGGNLITHRVVDVVNEGGSISFATKGDNNNKVDEERVQAGSLLGVHSFYIPKVGYVMNAIRSPLGVLLLVIVPTIGYFAIGLLDRKEHSEQRVSA